MPEGLCPLEQSREHRHTEMLRASPKSSCFPVPSVRGLPRRLFPWLGVVSALFASVFPWEAGVWTPRQCQR